jgi:lipopolysaccharide transport system permease protein
MEHQTQSFGMEEAINSHRPEIVPTVTSRQEEVEIVYTPNGAQRNGVSGWRTMFAELVESRRLIWLLMLRDISVRYRQSLLGYLWAVIPQIVTVGAFAMLNAWHVVPMGKTAIPYVIYALWGISVWQLFAGSLAACTTSLATAGALVTKINFPREVVVIAAIGQPIFDFLIRLVPVVAVFAWFGFRPSWGVILLPLALCPILLLALGLGFVLSIANLAVKDAGSALGTALTIGMFLTPVLYPPPVRWPFTLINILNPLSPLLTATQDLIATGVLSKPDSFFAACFFAAVVFLAGWRMFRVTIFRAAVYA